MNITNIKSIWYHNHMSQYQKNNLCFLQTAVDTFNGREASYVGVVYNDANNQCIVGYTAYGKITASHKATHIPSIFYNDVNTMTRSIAEMTNRIKAKVNEKLKKNYVQQDIVQITNQQVPKPKSKPVAQPRNPNPAEDRPSIRTSRYDFPDRLDIRKDMYEQLTTEGYVWQRYPNRMRMTYIILYQDCIALYNISGGLTADIRYDAKDHNLSPELLEDIGDGLMFTGHRDPVGNLVVQQYLGQVNEPASSTAKLTWAKQRSISTYIFNTLYNGKEDIYDTNLPIYLSDYVTSREDIDKLVALKDYGYASNVAFHSPHEPIRIVNVLER